MLIKAETFREGDILILNNTKTGICSSAIRTFTGQPYTHTAFVIGKVKDQVSIFEANLVTTIRPLQQIFDDKSIEFEIYRPRYLGRPFILSRFIKTLYIKYAGKEYGFLKILWFGYKRVAELLGYDVRKQKNWFSQGEICSEIVYRYLLIWVYKALHCKSINNKVALALKNKLEQWNENTVSPGDISAILQSQPKLFRLITERKLQIRQQKQTTAEIIIL
jgi:hypothetical protein